MAVFADLDKNIDSIFMTILSDELVKKLIVNQVDTADVDPLPSKYTEPNASKLILDTFLYDTPRVPDVTDEVKSFMVIGLHRGDLSSNNIHQMDVTIFIDILFHESIWRLKNGKRRPHLVLDSLTRKLKYAKIDNIRGSLVLDGGVDRIAYSNEFRGFTLKYRGTNRTSDCGDKYV